MPASMTSPVGNVMGNFTSKGGVSVSLQWIRVSSRSKITDFLPKYNQNNLNSLSSWEVWLVSASFPRQWQISNFQVFSRYAEKWGYALCRWTSHLCSFWLFLRCNICCDWESKDCFRKSAVPCVLFLEWPAASNLIFYSWTFLTTTWLSAPPLFFSIAIS